MKIIVNKEAMEILPYKSFFKKAIGLMGKKNITKGIVLYSCRSIHTFFMKEEIDVVMTDRNFLVLDKKENMKKNRILLPKKKVYYTFELPKGKAKNIKINTKLKIED